MTGDEHGIHSIVPLTPTSYTPYFIYGTGRFHHGVFRVASWDIIHKAVDHNSDT